MKKIIISAFILASSSTAFAANDGHNIFLDAERDYIPAHGDSQSHRATGPLALNDFLDAERSADKSGRDHVQMADILSAPTSVGSEDNLDYLNGVFFDPEK